MSTATYSSDEPSAPLGVKIICILGAIGGALGFLGSLALLGMAPAVGTVALIISIIQIVVVMGLWNLRSWAWTVSMIVYGLGLLLDLLAINILGLLIGIVVLSYLASKRRLFR